MFGIYVLLQCIALAEGLVAAFIASAVVFVTLSFVPFYMNFESLCGHESHAAARPVTDMITYSAVCALFMGVEMGFAVVSLVALAVAASKRAIVLVCSNVFFQSSRSAEGLLTAWILTLVFLLAYALPVRSSALLRRWRREWCAWGRHRFTGILRVLGLPD